MSRLRLWRGVRSLATRFLVSGLAAAFFGLASAAQANTIDNYRLEGTYGSGTNEAALVVDFAPGSNGADSFAFKVKFDTPTISSLGLMDAVVSGTANTSNPFTYTSTPSWGTTFVETMSYKGYSMVDDDDTGMSVQYWTSSDAGSSWTLGSTAIDYATLSNGETLGWNAQIIQWNYNDDVGWYSVPSESDYIQPVAPLAAPEPSTLALLAAAGLAAMAWRWRRRKQ